MRTDVPACRAGSMVALAPSNGSWARAASLTAMIVLILALFGAGIQTARSMLAGHGAPDRIATVTGNGPFEISQVVRSDGAAVEVTGLDFLTGVTADDLGGANHGVNNLVDAGQALVQVSVRIVNDSAKPLAYSSGKMTLRIGGAKGVAAMSSTIPDGRLAAGVSVEGTLGFSVVRNGKTLQLQLPSATGPILIGLGRADTHAADSSHRH